jgi:ferritin-like metal-binding protein YciE
MSPGCGPDAIPSHMELETLKDLYVHELKDLYSAENQLIKALPKMAKAATNRQLSAAFRQHLEQTRRHAKRLEQILKSHDESTRGPKCEGMEGLIAEGDKMAKEDAENEVRDAGLIAAAQRVEHYEIAGYGCARTYAQLLNDKAGTRLLDTTLQEEGATDKKLTKLARSVINLKAKKAVQKSRQDEQGLTGAIKGLVKKVTG